LPEAITGNAGIACFPIDCESSPGRYVRAVRPQPLHMFRQ
jgi:hypothetical protein